MNSNGSETSDYRQMGVLSRRDIVFGGLGAAAIAGFAKAHLPVSDSNRPFAEAFLLGFPAYEFVRTGWLSAAPGNERPNRYNRIVGRPVTLDHTARTVTTPNADTLYSSARIDLSGGPVTIRLPAVRDRYFSAAFLDAFTENFVNIRSDSAVTDAKTVIVTPPGWTGAIAKTDLRIASPTMDLWMLVRIAPHGPDGLARARAVQSAIVLDAPTALPFPVAPSEISDPANFVAVVNAVLARTGPDSRYRRRAAALAATGLRPAIEPSGARLTAAQAAAWTATIPAMIAALKAAGARESRHRGWRFPPRQFGRFGDDHRLRAEVALTGLGALAIDEAVYASTRTDSTGARLDGAKRYVMTIPRNVPADAFWSVSAYRIEPDGRLFFVENAAARYSANSRDPALVAAADGSVRLELGPAAPRPGMGANWLPTGGGPMACVFRAYRPTGALREGRWAVPLLMAV